MISRAGVYIYNTLAAGFSNTKLNQGRWAGELWPMPDASPWQGGKRQSGSCLENKCAGKVLQIALAN